MTNDSPRRMAITIVLGLLLFALMKPTLQVEALGEGLPLVYMLVVIAFGVLAPSRTGAFLVPALIPILAVFQCGSNQDGVCGNELGFPAYLYVFWLLLILPMLLGAGLGWALGVRWRGFSVSMSWRKKPVAPNGPT
jgi:hypothetical protein